MKIFVSLASQIMYRGLTQTFDHSKQDVPVWVTSDKEYAQLYSSDSKNVEKLQVSTGRFLDLGFRTLDVRVSFSEVVNRIRTRVMEEYRSERLNERVAMKAIRSLNNINVQSTEFKPVWEWIKQEQRHFVPILKSAGFDSIRNREGVHNNVITYGLLNKYQYKLVS